VVILGASVFSNGGLSDILKDRVDHAMEIYKNNKAKKIFVSGDGTKNNYNETEAIKNYLNNNQVPDGDMIIDPNGLNTLQSLKHAQANNFESIIIPTQEFHLPRAIYIAKKLHLKVYGYALEDNNYVKIDEFRQREVLANLKILFELAGLSSTL